MAYVSCPDCNMRFLVPDATKSATLRCPKCTHTFASPLPSATAPTAGGNGPQRDDNQFGSSAGDIASRILSASDEAMLRDFGAGTGLLDLTREAIGIGPGDRPRGPRSGYGAAADMADRQFQLVCTALTMANKLVDVYKGELARTRKIMLVCWAAVGVVLAGAIATLWWAGAASGAASLERSRAQDRSERLANLESTMREERDSGGKLAAALKAVTDEARQNRGDLLKAQVDLAKTHEELTAAQASAQVLTANLETANLKIVQLQKQAQGEPATQPASPTALRSK